VKRKFKHFKWQGYTNKDRTNCIENIKDAVLSRDGYIVNFNMFSDLAIHLKIEIPENIIYELHTAISQIIDVIELDKTSINPKLKNEVIIDLFVSFGSGKGKLKFDVPDVPG